MIFKTRITSQNGPNFAVMLTDCCPEGLVGMCVEGEVENLILTVNKKGNELDDPIRIKLEERKLDIEKGDFDGLAMFLDGESKGDIEVSFLFDVPSAPRRDFENSITENVEAPEDVDTGVGHVRTQTEVEDMDTRL
jgi:hypothetical protein